MPRAAAGVTAVRWRQAEPISSRTGPPQRPSALAAPGVVGGGEPTTAVRAAAGAAYGAWPVGRVQRHEARRAAPTTMVFVERTQPRRVAASGGDGARSPEQDGGAPD